MGYFVTTMRRQIVLHHLVFIVMHLLWLLLYYLNYTVQVSEGGELVPIRPLPWYPENLAWHSNFSRMQLRKNQTLER